ncbi:hypothetical protein [Clostridium butyricum]|uniref:hypothetical protein n=1 Tax=Clostridium butyricum TaxID=1492 RepID=UPI000542D808|nr:hypothetical protein [Clostridium butyricum]KHD14235.1 hypothetical protein OA81_16755 [Clostridium butyricum]
MSKKNSSNHSNNATDKYKSCELLLEHLTKEYDKEDSRSMKIDSRIPIFITLATFFGGFIFNLGTSSLKNVYGKGQQLYTIYVVLYALCLLSLIISIGIFTWILCTKRYLRIRTDLFLNENIINEEIKKTAFELMRGYQESLQHNVQINDKKMKQYNIGISFLVTSSILYLILQFFNFFIN